MSDTASAADKREAHVRGVKVTALSAVVGILAGVVSWAVTEGVVGPGAETMVGVYVLAAAVAVQQPLLPHLGKDEMSAKDWLYVAFMTFDLWFVAWTVLLTG